MNDYNLLILLQAELIRTLSVRKRHIGKYVNKEICRTKIRRLRLQIQEVMTRIESNCKSYTVGENEF